MNGDGFAVREFTHVLDVADAYRRALENTQAGSDRVQNVGSGDRVSIAQVVEAVAERTGAHVPVQHKPAQAEPQTLVADSSSIRGELGWSAPRSTLARIIDDAYEPF